MVMPTVEELAGEHFADIAASLARDLLAAHPRAIEPKPDPIFAVIEEARRLEAAANASEAATPAGRDVPKAPIDAVFDHLNGVLLKTVPTTGEGCQALARFVPAFFDRWGSSIETDAPIAFALIARSPLL